jgi:hypothetical protein
MNAMKIRSRFEEFHAKNPSIYAMLRELALKLTEAGYRRWSLRMLWGTLRYQLAIRANDPESDWGLNDHYTPHYARLLMQDEPALKDFFETRTLRAA